MSFGGEHHEAAEVAELPREVAVARVAQRCHRPERLERGEHVRVARTPVDVFRVQVAEAACERNPKRARAPVPRGIEPVALSRETPLASRLALHPIAPRGRRHTAVGRHSPAARRLLRHRGRGLRYPAGPERVLRQLLLLEGRDVSG